MINKKTTQKISTSRNKNVAHPLPNKKVGQSTLRTGIRGGNISTFGDTIDLA